MSSVYVSSFYFYIYIYYIYILSVSTTFVILDDVWGIHFSPKKIVRSHNREYAWNLSWTNVHLSFWLCTFKPRCCLLQDFSNLLLFITLCHLSWVTDLLKISEAAAPHENFLQWHHLIISHLNSTTTEFLFFCYYGITTSLCGKISSPIRELNLYGKYLFCVPWCLGAFIITVMEMEMTFMICSLPHLV